jgi:hypothetical protein
LRKDEYCALSNAYLAYQAVSRASC